MRKELPKFGARRYIGIGNQGGDGGGGGGNQSVQVQLVGDSTEMLQEIGEDVVPLLAQRKELRDVRIDTGDENSELPVRVDRERAAAFGFSAEQVAQFVGIALRGAPLREFRRGDSEVPVWVRFAGAEQFRMEDLSSFTVRRADGRTRAAAVRWWTWAIKPAATQIWRSNRQTTLTIKANLADKVTAPDARKAMEATLRPMQLPGRLQLHLRRRRLPGEDDEADAADGVQPADRAGDDLRGDGGGVRIAAVPGGDHERRPVLDLRRVLAVLAHRHRVQRSWPSSASWC